MTVVAEARGGMIPSAATGTTALAVPGSAGMPGHMPDAASQLRASGSLITQVLIDLRAGRTAAEIARTRRVDRDLVESAARQLVRLGLAQASGPFVHAVGAAGSGCSSCPSASAPSPAPTAGSAARRPLPLSCAGCVLARR